MCTYLSELCDATTHKMYCDHSCWRAVLLDRKVSNDNHPSAVVISLLLATYNKRQPDVCGFLKYEHIGGCEIRSVSIYSSFVFCCFSFVYIMCSNFEHSEQPWKYQILTYNIGLILHVMVQFH